MEVQIQSFIHAVYMFYTFEKYYMETIYYLNQ